MTKERAIELLGEKRNKHISEAFLVENDTLEGELIAALDMGIKAIDRNIAQKVLYISDGYFNGELVYDMAECPNCNNEFEDGYKNWRTPFCPNCGQALKWGNAENKEEEKNSITDGDS